MLSMSSNSLIYYLLISVFIPEVPKENILSNKIYWKNEEDGKWIFVVLVPRQLRFAKIKGNAHHERRTTISPNPTEEDLT